jgi:hypothetical protein
MSTSRRLGVENISALAVRSLLFCEIDSLLFDLPAIFSSVPEPMTLLSHFGLRVAYRGFFFILGIVFGTLE